MAFDAYLKMDKVEGESLRKGYEKAVEIISFRWGASNSVSHSAVGGQSAGRATAQSLTITKAFDKASPLFLKLLTTGKTTPKAELHCLKGTGSQQEPYLKLKFENVFVESISWSSGGEEAMEHVSLAFSKISVEHKVQGQDGKLSAGAPEVAYDFVKATDK